MKYIKRFDWLIIALLFIALLKILSPYLMTDIIIFSIFVLGFTILYGFMGKLSFGHMLYMGTGGYAAGLFAVHISNNIILSILFAILCGGIIGLLLGSVLVRLTGGAFALANLAFNQVGFFIVRSGFPNYTGGEDGLSVNFAPLPFINLFNPTHLFMFSLVILICIFIFIKIITSSSFGTLIKCIKEDEERVKFLGYNTYAYKIITFIISSSISALAGALWVINMNYSTISLISPLRNIEVVFAALIGGATSIYGAVLGGTIFMFISNFLAVYIPMWELALGISLLIIVFWFPRGIMGALESFYKKRKENMGELISND